MQTAVVICQVKHPIGDKPVAAVATNDHQKTHNTGVELVSHINSLGFLVALILDNTPPQPPFQLYEINSIKEPTLTLHYS